MSMKRKCVMALCCLSLVSISPRIYADVIVTGGDPESIYFNDRTAVGAEYMTRDGVGVGANAWDANPAVRQMDQGRLDSGFSGLDSRGMGGDALGGRSAGGGRR